MSLAESVLHNLPQMRMEKRPGFHGRGGQLTAGPVDRISSSFPRYHLPRQSPQYVDGPKQGANRHSERLQVIMSNSMAMPHAGGRPHPSSQYNTKRAKQSRSRQRNAQNQHAATSPEFSPMMNASAAV